MIGLAAASPVSLSDDQRRARWVRGVKLVRDVAAGLFTPVAAFDSAARDRAMCALLTPESKRFIDYLVDDALRELGLLD